MVNLETRRLFLREMTENDWDDLCENDRTG